MKLELKICSALPCETETFVINGIEADKDWFVNNYDDGDGEEIEYGCNNRVTEVLSLGQVRTNLPEELSNLTDDEIIKIQERLSDELVSGGCGWCV